MPDAVRIARFRDRPGVWLSYGGSAFLTAYRSHLDPLGLRPGWVTALAIIEERPRITQSALGRELRVNRASAMASCQQMAEEGLILREALPGRNRTGLTLTVKGQNRLEQACRIEKQLMETWMQGISDEEQAVFLSVLQKLTARAAKTDL